MSLPPIGAHVSAAGGQEQVARWVRAMDIPVAQFFTKIAPQWRDPEVSPEEGRRVAGLVRAAGARITVVHDSYLINLASPDPVLRRRSIESFVAELTRCARYGVDFLVSHPGNFMDSRPDGLQRNADGIAEALDRVSDGPIVCMELTAGQGTVLGSTFDEMRALLELVGRGHQSRLGVCLDSAHIHGAGYDLVGDYDGVWARFADVLGLSRLRVIHTNDSAVALGSRKDRHALIAEGQIGEAAFRRLMTDARFCDVPHILETPKGSDVLASDLRMLARLRAYAQGAEDPTLAPGWSTVEDAATPPPPERTP